ncbi:hypothetical protein BSKO_03643 [Bryopsis sp. KO-2023]|nr:hypothetical protein BSKO_03643 [Bryopsis sp. KO-2023]
MQSIGQQPKFAPNQSSSRNATGGLRVGQRKNWQGTEVGCKRNSRVSGSKRRLMVDCKIDYSSSPGDFGSVLERPSKSPLDATEVTDVFDYPRNLHDRFHVGEILGSGSYGIVRRCVDKDTGREYAMKAIPKTPKKRAATPRYLLKLRNEVDVMRQLGASLNAVYLESVYEDDLYVYLVMELCTGGPLLDRFSKRKMTEKDVAQITRSVLQFIAQCHAKGIVYRDVKTDNFLFLDKSPNCALKATDFGLSIRHWQDEPKLRSRTGTPAYMAPEVILQSYDEKADLWSVGMLTFQLLTGRFPFWKDIGKSSLKQVWHDVVNKTINLDSWEWKFTLSRGARSFLKGLLVRNPEQRLSATEALQHSWVMAGGTAEDLPLKGSVVQRLQRFATYGDLKQLVLKQVSTDLKTQDAPCTVCGELERLFNRLDLDHNGTISREELATGLRAQGYNVSDAEVEQLVDEVDVDNSGYIDFDEFMATLVDWGEMSNGDEWLPYLDRIFTGMDKDGNGFISLDELVDFIPPTDPNSTEEERVAVAKRMIREADRNEDGMISKEEFYEMMMNTVVDDPLSQYDKRLTRLTN